MRRLLVMIAMAGALLGGAPGAWAQKRMMRDGPNFGAWDGAVDWEGPMPWRGPQQSDEMIRQQIMQQITAILSMGREAGMDDWAWHDAVEDRLVALGRSHEKAVSMLSNEIDNRTGFERDALEVAAFRLENLPVNPREAAAAWAGKQAGATGKPGVSAKITRVMGMTEMFPHHLFYVAEWRGSGVGRRVVLAVAADSKVQAISDDAGLMRFLRAELPVITNEASRRRVARQVAVLGMARLATVYRPEDVTIASEAQTARATIAGDGRRVTASVTFDGNGRLAAATVHDESQALPAAAPVLAPNPTAIPALPE